MPTSAPGWYDGTSYNKTTTEMILDDDGDNVDDCIEEIIVDSWTPAVWNDAADGCKGPNNPQVHICRVTLPITQGWGQDGSGNQLWFASRAALSCAVLYDSDCGVGGHTADIEAYFLRVGGGGFGLQNPTGLRSNRNPMSWYPSVIQTIGHAGTAAETIDTRYDPTVAVNVYASEDKHASYLSTSSCNNLIDDCGTMVREASFRNLDAGEPSYPRIGDLGGLWSRWAGYTAWDGRTFLGGGAGSIKAKLDMAAPNLAASSYSSCIAWCTLSKTCCTQAGNSTTVCSEENQACRDDCLYSHCSGNVCW